MTGQELLGFFRARLRAGIEDPEFTEWIRQQPCVYARRNFGKCSGDVCGDHVLGGYHGIKANGLLKVPACFYHNRLAEQDARMHGEVILDAILLRLQYDTTKVEIQRSDMKS